MKPIALMWKSNDGRVKVTKTEQPKNFSDCDCKPVPLYTELKIIPDEWIDEYQKQINAFADEIQKNGGF